MAPTGDASTECFIGAALLGSLGIHASAPSLFLLAAGERATGPDVNSGLLLPILSFAGDVDGILAAVLSDSLSVRLPEFKLSSFGRGHLDALSLLSLSALDSDPTVSSPE